MRQKNFIYLLVLLVSIWCCDDAKEVKNLPGLYSKALNFRHYSGYLKVSATHYLHYWFVESESNPSSNPFLLWLNGGPGCSSLGGLLSEQGPFHIKSDGKTVYLNPYAWNKQANVLFLEAPAGVGFSYSTDGNVTTDDDQTSSENYEALKQFFSQFPQFLNHDVYIMGESYAGVYVPTLASRILDGQASYHINLKGLAIGNGFVSVPLNIDSTVKFAYFHGLVDQKLWETVENTCCHGCSDTCSFHDMSSKFCVTSVESILKSVWKLGLNIYDLYRDCYHPDNPATQNKRYRADLRGVGPPSVQDILEDNNEISLGLSSTKKKMQNLGLEPPCLNMTSFTDYLNDNQVRKALHIQPNFPAWSDCSEPVGAKYKKQYNDVFHQVRQALAANLRVLVYSGDTDMACNFLMGQKFSELLNLPLVSSKRAWQYNGQIAGFVTQYKNLDFMTVKGAGHMVPQWRAGPALYMINKYLHKEKY